MKKAAIVFVVVILVLVSIKTVWIIALRNDGTKLLQGAERADILSRRAYLVSRYRSGTLDPSHMPASIGKLFKGEWALGTCSMLVTALTSIAYDFPETRKESLEIARGAVKLALSDRFSEFDTGQWGGEQALASLQGSNGHVAYLGHVNMMLAAYRLLGGAGEFDELHGKISAALLRRLRNAPFPFLESYPQEIYTMDNTAAVASLRLYDQIFDRDNQALYRKWVTYARQRLLDPRTGLMVFSVTSTGKGVGPSRGSGVGWNSFYLPFVDKGFADEQYLKAKEHLVDSLPFGAKGLREYRHGIDGSGDIDSGPLVLGLSTSGTGFFVAGARLARDVPMLTGLLLTAESVGSSWQWNGKRQYLLAPLVGDAIMLAMKTARPWDNRFLWKSK